MNATPDHVIRTLTSMPDYVAMFKKAFPNEASPVTFDNFAKAIEAFEATLITPAAPFDQYLEGDANALTAQQKAGLKLFMDKGCSSCHNGINIGGQDYFPFGVMEKPGSDVLRRQGPVRGHQDGERRICVSRRASPQRRLARAVLSFGTGLELETSGRRDGRSSAWCQAKRQGRKRYRGIPDFADRAIAKD